MTAPLITMTQEDVDRVFRCEHPDPAQAVLALYAELQAQRAALAAEREARETAERSARLARENYNIYRREYPDRVKANRELRATVERLETRTKDLIALWRQQVSGYPKFDIEAIAAAVAVRLCADELETALAKGGDS